MLTLQAKTETLERRPAGAGDDAFLFELFAADRRAEFASFGLPREQAESLVAIEYRGRQTTYSQRYPEAEDSILLDDRGFPAGRLLLHRGQDGWRIVDIAVLPAQRGRGLASAAIGDCQSRCAECGASLELSVAPANPARALYERLGFQAISVDALAIRMKWDSKNEVVPRG